MSELTVTSTTDTPEAVAQALGVEADEVETETEVEPPTPETPAAEPDDESESGSASGADKAEPEPKADDEPDPDDDDTDDDSEPDPKAKAEAPKKKGGFQKKIDKLSRANFEKDREIADLRARLAQPPASKQERTETKTATSELPPRPKADDKNPDGTPKYQTYGELIEAQNQYLDLAVKAGTKDAIAEAKAEITKTQQEFEARQEQQRQIQALNETYQSRRNEARTLYPDWTQTVDENNDLTITPTMQLLMHTHPMGAHLAYWYGKNPDEVERISQLHPEAQKLELGYILKTLKVPAKSSTTTTIVGKEHVNGAGSRRKSAAPKPMQTKPGGRAAATVKDYRYYENASYEEYKKARETGVLK